MKKRIPTLSYLTLGIFILTTNSAIAATDRSLCNEKGHFDPNAVQGLYQAPSDTQNIKVATLDPLLFIQSASWHFDKTKSPALNRN